MISYLVIDAYNLIWQCCMAKAYSWMKSKKGERSGHVFGSLSKLRASLKRISDREKSPIKIIFAWDLYPKRTVELYPDYKAGRGVPEFDPIPDLRVLVSNLPCSLAYSLDEEADSVIYTLAHELSSRGKVYILSTDRDLWSCFDKATILTEKGGVLTLEEIEARFGLRDPRKIPLWKSVFGDGSDNIPKTKGLKSKEVIAAIEQSDGTPLSLFAKANGKSKSTLRANAERIKLFYQIVALKDVPLIVHENKGNSELLKKIVRHWDIVSMDERIDFIFNVTKEAGDGREIGKRSKHEKGLFV